MGDDEEASRAGAEARLQEIERRIAGPLPARPAPDTPDCCTDLTSNLTPEQYMAAVRQAKEYIAAGDIFQVVLSQRFSRETSAEAFSIYRALRRLNPSPYMFFFDFDGLVAGPAAAADRRVAELHVRLEGDRATLRPIAGTRPRSADPAIDVALERELLADPKERAEHVMLVDLARNDLGRVCAYGSVHVPELMTVERYSHVMHIVSHVEGRLRPELDGFDLVRATFPAGTVSGAPKIRAMEIIAELEGSAPRRLRGRSGLLLLRRLPRHLHRHPHPRHARADDQRAGGRRHRGRLGPGPRVRGDDQQGEGAGAGRWRWRNGEIANERMAMK